MMYDGIFYFKTSQQWGLLSASGQRSLVAEQYCPFAGQ